MKHIQLALATMIALSSFSSTTHAAERKVAIVCAAADNKVGIECYAYNITTNRKIFPLGETGRALDRMMIFISGDRVIMKVLGATKRKPLQKGRVVLLPHDMTPYQLHNWLKKQNLVSPPLPKGRCWRGKTPEKIRTSKMMKLVQHFPIAVVWHNFRFEPRVYNGRMKDIYTKKQSSPTWAKRPLGNVQRWRPRLCKHKKPFFLPKGHEWYPPKGFKKNDGIYVSQQP